MKAKYYFLRLIKDAYISKYCKPLILSWGRLYISMPINSTAKAHDFELYLQNFFNLNWLQPCIFLDPIVLKFETKKLLTYWLNLKGGQGFSSSGT